MNTNEHEAFETAPPTSATVEAETIERCAQWHDERQKIYEAQRDAVATCYVSREALATLASYHAGSAKGIRALASQPADELWCLHILGPDDVHPAPSREHAERAAAAFNERFGPLATKDDVLMEAVAAPWPHDAESHAELVGQFIESWMIPRAHLAAIKAGQIPAKLAWCAMDRDECTVTLAFDTEEQVNEFIANHPSRNRTRVVDEQPADKEG